MLQDITHEIKSRIAMGRAAIKKKTTLFNTNLRKKACEMLCLEQSYIWCWNFRHFRNWIRNIWKVL